jgi:hypothetical protein
MRFKSGEYRGAWIIGIWRRSKFSFVSYERWEEALSCQNLYRLSGWLRKNCSIIERILRSYRMELIEPHSFSQKREGPFFPSTILPQNIHAGSLEYLCLIYSGSRRSLPFFKQVIYEFVWALPNAYTLSIKQTCYIRKRGQVLPSSTKSSLSWQTLGSSENPFFHNTRRQ